MFQRTTAVNKLLAMKARKKVVQGGTSAGKTYGIIPVLIDRAIKTKRIKITIVAETIPAARDGAADIFKNIMQDIGRWNPKGWIGSPMQYTFFNGSVIQFKAFDTIGKAKASGKRDILFINEANHIPFAIADALMIRSKEIWIDYNPDFEFWAHTEVLTEPNSEFLLLKYTDNEGLPPETLEDLLLKIEKSKTSKYWEDWCRIYIDGQIGRLEGVILPNWTKIDKIPPEARLVGRGMDFGFTNDPTTLVSLYKWNGQYIWDEEIFETGLTNQDIAKRLKQIGVRKNDLIVADSAEPKSIKEINRYGFSIVGATKGADSIKYGLSILQEEPFLVTSRSLNLINELRRYSWDKDKLGNVLNRPIDMFNHCVDAMRYLAIKVMGKDKKRKGIKRRN